MNSKRLMHWIDLLCSGRDLKHEWRTANHCDLRRLAIACATVESSMGTDCGPRIEPRVGVWLGNKANALPDRGRTEAAPGWAISLLRRSSGAYSSWGPFQIMGYDLDDLRLVDPMEPLALLNECPRTAVAVWLAWIRRRIGTGSNLIALQQASTEEALVREFADAYNSGSNRDRHVPWQIEYCDKLFAAYVNSVAGNT